MTPRAGGGVVGVSSMVVRAGGMLLYRQLKSQISLGNAVLEEGIEVMKRGDRELKL